MIANRISYCLGLTGPSYTVDTACSSSMFALDCAFSALRSGQADHALVCGTNLTLHPYTTLNFVRLGVLSPDGFCRPFDQNANGYFENYYSYYHYLLLFNGHFVRKRIFFDKLLKFDIERLWTFKTFKRSFW